MAGRMSNVVQFIRPEAPHVTGPAICSVCGYKWEGVAPAGTFGLECPECGQHAGAWRYGIMPQEGEFLECQCGGCLFVAMRILGTKKLVCATCGAA